jgi:16S rRNA (cytosine1402-N4)-methyltransferase
VGIDLDPAALEIAAGRLADFGERVLLVNGDFRDMGQTLKSAGIEKVDGVLLDLGVSSMQLDNAERGFSFMRNGPLDMRMNPEAGGPASEIVNTWQQKDLSRLIARYGEERKARDIAGAIVREREKKSILTTQHLARVITAIPGMGSVRNIHPATRTFQALRIEVNDELAALEETIPEAVRCLAAGGRMAVISFHSLEDRIVKRSFREQENPCRCPREFHECLCGKVSAGRVVTRRPVLPSDKEARANPRSRSAKLRIFEKKGESGKEKLTKDPIKG